MVCIFALLGAMYTFLRINCSPLFIKRLIIYAMNKPIKVMQVALLSLCLAGCQQRTFLMDESELEEERIPVMFSGTIQTRMANNAWEADDKIGVFMFKTGQIGRAHV